MRRWSAWAGIGLLGAVSGALLGYLLAAGLAAVSNDPMTGIVMGVTAPVGAGLGALIAIVWAWWRQRSGLRRGM